MRLSLRNQLNGKLDNCSCFYDWFCKYSILPKKAEGLLKKVKFLVDMGCINPDTVRIWFKNNCPCNGSLYDDIRISTLEEDSNFLGGVCPSSGHNVIKGECEVWKISRIDSEYTRIGRWDSWSEFKKELKTNSELLASVKEAFWVD